MSFFEGTVILRTTVAWDFFIKSLLNQCLSFFFFFYCNAHSKFTVSKLSFFISLSHKDCSSTTFLLNAICTIHFFCATNLTAMSNNYIFLIHSLFIYLHKQHISAPSLSYFKHINNYLYMLLCKFIFVCFTFCIYNMYWNKLILKLKC